MPALALKVQDLEATNIALGSIVESQAQQLDELTEAFKQLAEDGA